MHTWTSHSAQVTTSPVLMKTGEVMKKMIVIQPSQLVLVMINLSIGVSRVFVPQREADVHRSGT